MDREQLNSVWFDDFSYYLVLYLSPMFFKSYTTHYTLRITIYTDINFSSL